jgi:cytoskeleton protein RodZ
MGELPTTEPARHGWTRWAIPLTLIAIIGATAAWEFLHPDAPRLTAKKDAAPAPAKASAPEVIGTPLRNPVAGQQTVAAMPDQPASVTETPGAAVVQATSEPAPDMKTGEAAVVAPVVDAPLMLAFRDYSWTVVKDRTGRVLLSRMNRGGTTQALAGTPPLDVVIGNAADVTLTWKGQRIDLAPYTQRNVARFTLE